jgi:hypothetical protein
LYSVALAVSPADVDLKLLDVGQLAVEPHLELALVADHRRGLLSQRLVLTLRLLDGLLDLHFRVGVFVDLRVEQRHDVLPRLDERIGHGFSSAFVCRCLP